MVSPVPVDEIENLDRLEFLEDYRFRKPVIARGAARRMPAFEKWDNDYLMDKIGNARVEPLVYASDKRDYSTASFVAMSFREFCARIANGNNETLYWFEGPSSANFWGGEDKQIRLNDDICVLAEDFQIPAFLKRHEVILAQVIMGTGKNGTLLHHDFGGEAKAMIQLRGEKHVLLVPPQHAGDLNLNAINTRKNFTISNLKMREGDCERLLDQGVPVYAAHLRPGDILYWPSFWFHDVSNSGEINLAVNMPIDELYTSPTLLRHLLASFYKQALTAAERDQSSEAITAFLNRFVQQAETGIMQNTNVSTLWDLVISSPAYQGKHWRKETGEKPKPQMLQA